MNQVIIVKDTTKKTVEFLRVLQGDILEAKVFPNGFEVRWRPSIQPNVFSVFSEDDNFAIEYREIDTVLYPNQLAFYNFLKDLADYSQGNGGGGGNVFVSNNQDPSTASNQNLILAQDETPEEADYFNFSDIENPLNSIEFPLTCEITAISTTGQSIPTATYADLDALIAAFNNGINLYEIEKRTESSFYVKSGTANIDKESEITIIAFNTFLTARVFRFFRLNTGAYPSSQISVTRTKNELQRAINGIGFSVLKSYDLAPGSSIVFYAWRNISIDVVDAVTESVAIESVDGTFTSALYPRNTSGGDVVSGIDLNPNVVQKIPFKITNNGIAVCTVEVSLTK